ncbi:hypothetical protein Aple_001820 [Acrocarpospora pleiomorpha]|uniref:HTH tetR-type domain-containing protein n=1 Tax=Acrocarpospora pleiomorpha TaxID=90975 RepID=A0A5M3X6H2_9ACTN|nr:TetR family transcriptional regulator [Acrocarpospora pleiomorpha]GES17287.1 hypothetical protein Aple_001820 [Acrocarpospora pleiomorpha]
MRRTRTGSNRIPADQRRAEILRCAAELFAARGFVPTTMDDVAEAANITKRTLYRYVPSKEDLLFEIHDTFSGHALVPSDRQDITDPTGEFRRVVRQTAQMVADHPTEIGVFFEERKHLGPAQARLIEERRDAYEAYAASVVQAGIDAGAFADLPARTVAQTVLGTVTEMYRWYHPDGPLSPAELADQYGDLFLHGAAAGRALVTTRATARPISTPAAGNSQDHRERVRLAAVKSFAEHGYHATSMRDLADVADVTKGAVMYHAGYKNDLLEQIHRSTFQESLSLLHEELANDDDSTPALDSLHRLITVYMRFVAANRDAIAVINDNMRYLDTKSYRRIDRLRNDWLAIFRAVLDRAEANGEIVGVSPSFLARALVGMFNSAARWYNPRGRLRPDALAQLFSQLLFHGLAAGVTVR